MFSSFYDNKVNVYCLLTRKILSSNNESQTGYAGACTCMLSKQLVI